MLKPVKRRILIKKLHLRGFDGPYSAGKHEYMEDRGRRRISIPNPHNKDIGVVLLKLIIKEIGISAEKFNEL